MSESRLWFRPLNWIAYVMMSSVRHRANIHIERSSESRLYCTLQSVSNTSIGS